jgi:hypothetical protein
MSYFMIDVETDGPIPGDFSMISFGAVLVNEGLDQTFYGRLEMGSGGTRGEWSLARRDDGVQRSEASDAGFRRVGERAKQGTSTLHQRQQRVRLQFINWYFWHFTDGNPFGHTSTNLGSLYKGLVQDTFQSFKHLRKTAHTHHPVDDAKGNAEALLEMKRMGLKISL